MEKEKAETLYHASAAGEHKQTIEEKIAIRMKKCGNLANAHKGDTSFLSAFSDPEKKMLASLLKKCLLSQRQQQN